MGIPDPAKIEQFWLDFWGDSNPAKFRQNCRILADIWSGQIPVILIGFCQRRQKGAYMFLLVGIWPNLVKIGHFGGFGILIKIGRF